MSHVAEGDLHAYLDGALSFYALPDAERIRLHLERCPECRRRMEVEAALVAGARSILALAQPDRIVPPPFEELRRRASAGGAATGRASGWKRPARRGWLWAATVAASLGLGWGVGIWHTGSAPSGSVSADAVPGSMEPGAPSGSADATLQEVRLAGGSLAPDGVSPVDVGGEGQAPVPALPAAPSTRTDRISALVLAELAAVAPEPLPAPPPIEEVGLPLAQPALPLPPSAAPKFAAAWRARAEPNGTDPTGSDVGRDAPGLAAVSSAGSARTTFGAAVPAVGGFADGRRGPPTPAPATVTTQLRSNPALGLGAVSRGGAADARSAPSPTPSGLRPSSSSPAAAAPLSLPGLDVELVEWTRIAGAEQGVRLVQRLADGTPVELRFLGVRASTPGEPRVASASDPGGARPATEGSAADARSAAPPAPLLSEPLPEGWSQLARPFRGGWMLIRGPMRVDRLEALLEAAGVP